MNNIALDKANVWLKELGLRTEPHNDYLSINRDDARTLFTVSDNEIAVALILELKSALNYKKFYWGKGDELNYHLCSF